MNCRNKDQNPHSARPCGHDLH